MDRPAEKLDFSAVIGREIPHFFLYGEPPQDAAARFLHVETLVERSRPSNWNIRSHAHRDLHHIFHITQGAGEVSFDGLAQRRTAAFLLLVPAGVVHAFAWEDGTDGTVLTVADSYVREITAREPQLSPLFAGAACLPIAEDESRSTGLKEAFLRISHETAWHAPGHDAAVQGHLLIILVAALRLMSRQGGAAVSSPQAQLVGRFRDAVERDFRSQASVADYASALGVTAKQLRSACVRVAGKSPLQLIRQRTTLEARRLLIYSNMSVAEIGYSLGFDDPAYFSRFFSIETGESPRAFRDAGEHRATAA
jgi:AraC family transcriptional activator of pobA